jgi:hypothetical protein
MTSVLMLGALVLVCWDCCLLRPWKVCACVRMSRVGPCWHLRAEHATCREFRQDPCPVLQLLRSCACVHGLLSLFSGVLRRVCTAAGVGATQLAVAPGLVKASEQVDVRVVVVECVDEGPSYGGIVYSFSSILALA